MKPPLSTNPPEPPERAEPPKPAEPRERSRPAPLTTGKLPVELLGRLLAAAPSPPPEVLLGPGIGEDACAIEVPGGTLVAATDPITFTAGEVGSLSVIVNANDIAVTGARPRWFLAVVLVPPGTDAAAVEEVFAAIHRSLAAVGAHLVGGHTEVTSAVSRPVVVGQMLGLAPTGTFVRTAGLRPGDAIVQVGPAPVEGAAVLAREAAGLLRAIDPETMDAARRALADPGISVVEPALLSAGLGATSVHDPTEGGLAAGLHEMAYASEVRIRVDPVAVLWFEPGIRICRALEADPWSTLASGALLSGLPPGVVDRTVASLADRGYRTAVIGRAEPGSGVVTVDGRPIAWPERDEVARVLSAPPSGEAG